MKKPLVPQRADHDGTCVICHQTILGYYGRKNVSILEQIYNDPPPAHPIDTLDIVVKIEGGWAHEECAKEQDA